MSEGGGGTDGNIFFDLLPVTLVVADFFAPRAERQHAGEGFDLTGQLRGLAQRRQRVGARTEE